MKKQKMSLEKMRGVLNNVLSREEMKEVMAGSGGSDPCGACTNEATGVNFACYFATGTGGTACFCGGNPNGNYC